MKQKVIVVVTILFFIIGIYSFLTFTNRNTADCANSISCIKELETQVDNNSDGVFLGAPVAVPSIELAQDDLTPKVLGEESNQKQKHIYVDLSKQKLYAYEDTELFFETLVSTGRWGRTPTGDFQIWIKIRATKMSGGSGNDYYYLPNVPYVMFFYNSEIPKSRGFGLHGTYWHNNFGHEMSHGCVNLRTIDAKVLYDWTSPTNTTTTTYATTSDPGTPITICQKLEIVEGATPLCVE